MYAICASMWLALLMPLPAPAGSAAEVPPVFFTGSIVRHADSYTWFASGGAATQIWFDQNPLLDFPILQTCCRVNSPIFYGALLTKESIPCEGIWPALVDRRQPDLWSPAENSPLEIGEVLIFSSQVPPIGNYLHERLGINLIMAAEYRSKLLCKDELAEIAVEVSADPIATLERETAHARWFVELLDSCPCRQDSSLWGFFFRSQRDPGTLTQLTRTLQERQRSLQESRTLTRHGDDLRMLLYPLAIFDLLIWHFNPSGIEFEPSEIVALDLRDQELPKRNISDLWQYLLARYCAPRIGSDEWFGGR